MSDATQENAREAGWDEKFEAVLRRSLPYLALDQSMAPTATLLDLGLDSLATIQLILDLEGSFDVVVPDESMTAESFQTVGSLWRMLEQLLHARSYASGPADQAGA